MSREATICTSIATRNIPYLTYLQSDTVGVFILYVTTYATLSHFHGDVFNNQRQLAHVIASNENLHRLSKSGINELWVIRSLD